MRWPARAARAPHPRRRPGPASRAPLARHAPPRRQVCRVRWATIQDIPLRRVVTVQPQAAQQLAIIRPEKSQKRLRCPLSSCPWLGRASAGSGRDTATSSAWLVRRGLLSLRISRSTDERSLARKESSPTSTPCRMTYSGGGASPLVRRAVTRQTTAPAMTTVAQTAQSYHTSSRSSRIYRCWG